LRAALGSSLLKNTSVGLVPFFGSHCWQSHHVGGSVGDSVRSGTLGRAACTAAVLYILVISHATFPSVCERQSCPHCVGHPQAPEDKEKRGHRHCNQLRRCTVERLLPPPTHPFAAGAGSGGTNKCRTCPGSSLFLPHFPSASLRGTGTKGAAPIPPVPRTGPSMGGYLHACVLSQREGRSAIPPAAGTACMIRTNASLSRPNYSHARTQIPIPSLSYRCIAVDSGCSLHTSDPVDC